MSTEPPGDGSPFDLIGGLMGAQAEGYRAAMRMAGQFLGGAPTSPIAGGSPADLGRMRVELQRAADLAFDVMRSVLDAAVDSAASGVGADDTIAVTVAPGGSGATVAYLHNEADTEVTGLRPRLGRLETHDGTVLDPALSKVLPEVVTLPARSRVTLDLEVTSHESTTAGIYQGLLYVEGLHGSALPVTVTVE